MNTDNAIIDPIELWKAIHGGCWPGPYPDPILTGAAAEVIAGLAMLNASRSFADTQISKQVHALAVESLGKSLSNLQRSLK